MSYFQKDSPGKDKKANWLPSPDGDFGLSPCTARIISKIETKRRPDLTRDVARRIAVNIAKLPRCYASTILHFD